MILPPRPVSTQCRATLWLSHSAADRLTSSTESQSSGVRSSASTRRMMPALLTRMSISPKASRAAPTISAGAPDAATSRFSPWKRRPAASTSRAVSVMSERWTPRMSAPACASATAIARPRPLPAPVTMAHRPVRSNIAGLIAGP